MTTRVGLVLGFDDGISVATLVGRADGATVGLSVTLVGDVVGMLVSVKSPPPSATKGDPANAKTPNDAAVSSFFESLLKDS